MVVFQEPKDGNTPDEWEDGAYAGAVGSASAGLDPSTARFILLDGATEAYDVRRWVDQLTGSFMGSGDDGHEGRPPLEPETLQEWFVGMQKEWQQSSPVPRDYIEQQKFLKFGSFATLLGCEITGLDGPEPTWKAVALGDTVLFHVRKGQRPVVFPALGPDDFNTTPAVLHTSPSRLYAMAKQLQFAEGSLAPGDLIFAATDALAQWIIKQDADGNPGVWPALETLCHPATFARLIADQRRRRMMTNDDVTLLRVRVVAEQPSAVLICQ